MKSPLLYLSMLVIIALALGKLCAISQPLQNEPGALPATDPAEGSEEALESPVVTHPMPGPAISGITLNLDEYPDGKVPAYHKLEITFQIQTVAANLQLPYDPTPPPGIQTGTGISVDAQFTPDNWKTVYTQPAFYYQEFLDQVKNHREWFYPSGEFAWKVRFAPDQAGTWQFKLVARDASGGSETNPQTFTAVASNRKGYIRVSKRDPRYFEFEDGSYFPGLGYNMNFDHVSWTNPTLDNESNFRAMSENGIQLVRIWLTQWGIYGPSWNPWNAVNPDLSGQPIPFAGLSFTEVYPGGEVSMRLDASSNPCMFIGFMKPPAAVKAGARYRVRVRYKTKDLEGPRQSGAPFGFVAKSGDWLWEEGQYCHESGTGQALTQHQDQDTADWQVLEGSYTAGNADFLPYFYLVLENANRGSVYIDYVWIEDELGDGNYGPNIVSKPWMSHDLYFEQRNSYAFDKVLELAERYGIYLRPVILEKNDWIFNRIDFQGLPILFDPLCSDADPGNDPPRCPGNNWFYGNGRQVTKVRWLQRAWWRYLQARWGYSTQIHSWELLNEGDPVNSLHYQLADEFGIFMQQFVPDHHLVSTSFWHSFPREDFWANPNFTHLDFADIHLYVEESDPVFEDTALSTYNPSMQFGARQPGGAGKPVIRGETGFVVQDSAPATSQFLADTDGLWLHNFIWGGINPGGLIESYWYEVAHIYRQNRDGEFVFDLRPHFKAYYNFISRIPLNNGGYQDVEAVVSNPRMRAWGQKDVTHGSAHLWIQNTDHTWVKVIGGFPIPKVSGDIRIDGFQPGAQYALDWWDTYQPDESRQVVRSESVTAARDGSITLTVSGLAADIAIQLSPMQ